MRLSELFEKIYEFVGIVPDMGVIERIREDLLDKYSELRIDPLIYANGSVPLDAKISEDLVPGRKLRVEIFRVRNEATSLQGLMFIERPSTLHLGALGLMLMRRLLPIGVSCIAFEESAVDRMSALMPLPDDEYQFMILKKDATWTGIDAFIRVTPLDDE